MRLGDDLAVRLPWATPDADALRKEYTFFPTLAPSLPLPVPVPRRQTHLGPTRPRRPATPHRHHPLTPRSPLRPTAGVINHPHIG